MARSRGAGPSRRRGTGSDSEDEEQPVQQRQGKRGRVENDDESDEDVRSERRAVASRDRVVNNGAGARDGEEGDPMDQAVDDAKKHLGKTVFENKVMQLVRLALFCEQKRQPLRRDEINKKVLDKSTRQFKPILHEAQRVLRSRLGMELVELRGKGVADGQRAANDAAAEVTQPNGRSKGKGKGKKTGQRRGHGDDDDDDDDENEDIADDSAQAAVAPASRQKVPTSRSFILRSVLPPDLVTLLATPAPIITQPESDGLSGGGGGVERQADCGAIVDFDKGDGGAGGVGGVGFMGLTWVILAVILVHDRSIRDDLLRRLLKNKLLIDSNTLLPFVSPDAISAPPTLDSFLKQLTRQGYLEQVKSGNAAVLANVDGAPQADVEWRWGARADAEINERAVAEFMADIQATAYDDDDDGDDAVANGRGSRAGGAAAPARETPRSRRDNLISAVEKAAGGELA